jgi:hypothetical protein
MILRGSYVAALLAAFALGCSKASETSTATKETPVREVVAELQAALKARDDAKVWKLLDGDSQADADRVAKTIQGDYVKASAETKAEQEKALGLSAAELTSLTGIGFLKTKRFRGKYDELPDSKIDAVTVQGDKATVAYTEPDGDKEKLTLVRQENRWKVSLPMPKP